MLNLCFRTFNRYSHTQFILLSFHAGEIHLINKMKNEKTPLILLMFQESNNDDSKLNMKVIIKVLKV